MLVVLQCIFWVLVVWLVAAGMYCEQICDTSSLENRAHGRDVLSPLVFRSVQTLVLIYMFVNEQFILFWSACLQCSLQFFASQNLVFVYVCYVNLQ